MEMRPEQCEKDRRIAELEQTVHLLSCRGAALEAVQPHMASKAEMIASRGIFNFHFGKRKRNDAGEISRRDSAFTFLLLILTPPALVMLVIFLSILLR